MNTLPHVLAPGNLPHFLLWMGDSGLATVVTGAVAFSLAIPRETRGMAWRWAAAFVLMTSLVFATKLGLFGWDNGIDALDFRGPSGHATLSAFVWPMVAWALTLHASRRFRDAALFLGAAFALAVAWILVAFNFHSVPEVVAGSLLGGLASCICIRVGRFAMPPPKHVTVMAGLLVAILFGIQHGKHLPVLNQFKWKLHQLVTLDSAKGAHFRRSSG